jgi:uncharacterized protein YecE (DUF72 family)
MRGSLRLKQFGGYKVVTSMPIAQVGATCGIEARDMAKAGKIRVGMGGWTFEPWRGVFYPRGLTQKRELEFASRAVTTIEINGTYYSTFKPDNWRKWRDETPDDFAFSVKASRFCTNRKELATAGPAIEKFFAQGMTELGAKLGPINWQFALTKRFVPEDFEAFLALLPKEVDGIAIRHALEVRHASFAVPTFTTLAKRYKAAIVYATGKGVPTIDEHTGGFAYARIMTSREALKNGFKPDEFKGFAAQAELWAKRGDVFHYFISGAKVRDPAAAQTLLRHLGGGGVRSRGLTAAAR